MATAHTCRSKLSMAGISRTTARRRTVTVERALLGTSSNQCNSAMRCVPRRSRYIENVGGIDYSARLQLLAAYRQHGTTQSLSRMNAASERSFSFAAAFGFKEGRSFREQVRLCATDVFFPCAALLTLRCLPAQVRCLLERLATRARVNHRLARVANTDPDLLQGSSNQATDSTKTTQARRRRSSTQTLQRSSEFSAPPAAMTNAEEMPSAMCSHVAAVNTGGKRASFMFFQGVLLCESGKPDVKSHDSEPNTDHCKNRTGKTRNTIMLACISRVPSCAPRCTRSLCGSLETHSLKQSSIRCGQVRWSFPVNVVQQQHPTARPYQQSAELCLDAMSMKAAARCPTLAVFRRRLEVTDGSVRDCSAARRPGRGLLGELH